MGTQLTALQMAVLEFERSATDLAGRWRRFPGEKDTAVREFFGLNPWRYSQILTQLLDTPAAETYDPTTVRRLRRLRAERRAAAGGQRLGVAR